jgi:arylsulfatase A-like enzyme
MRKIAFFLFAMLGSISLLAQQKPNIIYILADDLGYGDVSCLNKDSKISTPNIDKLAKEGMSFMDAHSNSAVCTPTRYGILTGRYAWRTRLQNGVLWGYDTMLISKNRTTIASMLKGIGYQTACIGKWHLGLGWQKNESGKVDFTRPLTNGPTQVGFDYFYGIPSSLDIPPYFYIENTAITATSIDSTKGNNGKGFWRAGPAGNDFKHTEVLSHFTDKAISFIDKQASSGQPFFLYFPLTSPHTPILPSDKYLGKTGTNAYGDFVAMTDDLVGRISEAVDRAGIGSNTIIVFTSDNGASPMSDFKELAAVGHYPSYIYRGTKADIFEAGHRVPFIIKWPGVVKGGTENRSTICLTDFLATMADRFQIQLKDDEGEDSYSILPLLLQQKGYQRKSTVHHSIDGKFSIREGRWKLILAQGSGGWSSPTEKEARERNLPAVQLYDLEKDIAETDNVAAMNPVVVRQLSRMLEKIIEDGRSTKGKGQANDVEVKPPSSHQSF